MQFGYLDLPLGLFLSEYWLEVETILSYQVEEHIEAKANLLNRLLNQSILQLEKLVILWQKCLGFGISFGFVENAICASDAIFYPSRRCRCFMCTLTILCCRFVLPAIGIR